MSDPSGAASPPAEPERPTGFFANLVDLYFAPAEAFRNLLRKPDFVTPMILHVVMSLAFTAIWLQKVDMGAFFAARMQESGRSSASIPADRMEQIEKWTRVTSWVGGAVFPPLFALALAGLSLFVYRFFYASELSFKQSLTIVASSFGALALVTTPLLLGVFALKDDWTIPPQEALQANFTLFLEKQTAHKALWAFTSSLDLFSFWLMFVLASGFGVAGKRTWSWALPGIAVPWAIYVAGKVGISLLR